MDKNNLKRMWLDAHAYKRENPYGKVSIQKTLNMNHCGSISKALSDLKLKIILYSSVQITFIGLMIYAMGYLRLTLSMNSIIPLALVNIFLVVKIISEIHRYIILTKTTDNMSVKESLQVFRKRLERIRISDFISYLIFFYLLAIMIIFNYITDIGGIKNFSMTNEILPLPLLIFLILMLLSFPWFLKYQHRQRYKNLYLNLSESADILNDED